jgi:hypothetical protein
MQHLYNYSSFISGLGPRSLLQERYQGIFRLEQNFQGMKLTTTTFYFQG